MLRIAGLVSLLTTVNAEPTTPTLVPTQSPYINCMTGNQGSCDNHDWSGPQEYKVLDRGYHLSKTEIFEDGNDIIGIKLYFEPDVAGTMPSLLSSGDNQIGKMSQPGSDKKTEIIIKRVRSVKMVRHYGQRNIVLTFKDGTTQRLIAGSSANYTPSFELPLCGNLIGLRCNFAIDDNDTRIEKLGACDIYDDLPVT